MSNEHIKMPDIAPLVRYLADGNQNEFVYPFPVFTSADIAVYLNGARQYSGYSVTGAGKTEGGSIIFAAPPANGVTVMIERRLVVARMSDFIEGGDFSAKALNNELDFLTAAIQQAVRDQSPMLRYDDNEAPAAHTLPPKALRAGKVLGFDGAGNPVAVSAQGTMAAPDYTAPGTDAATRSSHDKFTDQISVRDFGAVGDGVSDDTLAFQKALAAHDHIFVPEGQYLITAPVTLSAGQSLFGAGQRAVIKAQSNSFGAVEIPAGYTRLACLRIEGGAAGVRLWGRDGECVQNALYDLHIAGADTGIVLDGYDDTNKPCYWNNFERILIEQPGLHGVHLVLSGAGDTPNANRFAKVRVYSKGAASAGSGFYVEDGGNANSFIDCEANVNGTSAQACFRIGAGASQTMLLNLYTESTDLVPNVQLDDGSSETALVNLHAQSDGAAIYDLSGGQYDAYNAGYPYKNRMRRTSVTDLTAQLMRYDTEFIDTPGTAALDLSHSMHLVNASGGAITAQLPAASSAAGVEMTIKKLDSSAHIVTITEDGGPGPDGSALQLGGAGDYVTVLSNGAGWFVTSSNRMAGNTRFIDSSGTIDIDMAVDVYLLSSFGGAMTARLPPADAAAAIGRTVTLKKTDSSANEITVTEQGGAGPDQSSQSLSGQYDAITVVSDGGQWFVVSRYS